MCFFAGGLTFSEQAFGVSKLALILRNCPFRNLLLGATQYTTLLKISVIAVLLPTAFHISVADRPLVDSQKAHVLVAVILLFSKRPILSPCFILEPSAQFMRVTLLSNCTPRLNPTRTLIVVSSIARTSTLHLPPMSQLNKYCNRKLALNLKRRKKM